MIDSNRRQSTAIGSNRASTAIDGFRRLSAAIARSMAIGGIRLLSMAVAFTALAEPIDGFDLQVASGESAAARLEARGRVLVAPRVVTGTQSLVSSNGLATTAWDTTALANGWHEVEEPDSAGELKVSLLALNAPDYQVEGGRLLSNATWTSNSVHWVRNRVVVPDGVTLTIREGTIVKFGEGTGITVENCGNLKLTGKSNARIVLTSFADDAFGGDDDFGATNAVYGTWSVDVNAGGTMAEAYTHVRYGALAGAPTVSMPVTVTAQRTDGKARIPVTFSATGGSRVSLHWRAADGTAKYGEDYLKREGEETWTDISSTTAYFEIPLVADSLEEGVKEFSVELVSLEEANPNPSRLKTTVVVVTGNPFPSPVWAESALSEAIRLENRDPDPKPEPVPATMAIEGGRLLSNATWPTAATNFVLNAVVIPDGVTLTIEAGATVFFAPHTGLKVEKGGTLRVVGSAAEPVLFTAEEKGDYALTVLDGATFTDAYAQFDKTTVSQHPTLSIPSGCEVSERNGRVQIPVNVSGSRTSAFRVKWRATDGTATFGEDYELSEGEIEWGGTSDGTKYITIPIPNDGVEEESETFIVELYDAQGANLGATARCTVLIRDGTAALVPVAVSAESEASEAVRLENRAEGTLGKAIVRGVEYVAADGDTSAEAWDSTQVADGWQENGTLVRNDPSIAVEGGRLQMNVIWTSNAVHLVRNMVVVPDGVTLTVTTNAIVKFCESTGIKVEAGGTLRLLGSLEENVVFTLANDDAIGGDTDMEAGREWAASNATYTVTAVSGGTFTDLNAVFRGTTVSTYGTASVNAQTVVDGGEGVIRIPVFVTGSRTTQFSVDWETSDGHAGRLVWAKAADGTKYIELDTADCAESFTLALVESRGINISATAFQTAVTVYRNELDCGVSAESEPSEAVRLENRADGTLARALVFGTEYVSADGDTRAVAWDSTTVADGWQENGTLVRNSQSIAVEGGRLLSNATWGNDVTHLVRNWVVVPNGVTLTISAGTVVKFCEKTGFKVEAGGRLVVAGTEESPVVYTAAADDTIGGDSDLREATPNDGDYGVNIVSGGTYTDQNCAVRYTTFSNLGTASVPDSALAAISDGLARIPVFISTDRTTKFCADWRVVARGVPDAPPAVVTNLSGRVVWSGKNDGTKFIALPLMAEALADGFASFEVELYESQGINISTTARRCAVTVYADNLFPAVAGASSGWSEAVRLENRDWEWSYGAPIVFGTEYIAADGDTRAKAWDSTAVADGWLDMGGASLLVRNSQSIAVEGGRLPSNATWTSNVTHLVRNWVVVPDGVTLTVAAGAVVKFCDATGIKVEAGGRLVSAGTAASEVIFTSVNDDTAGGDTDLMEEEPLSEDYQITVISGGTFTDTHTQMRYGTSGTFGYASVPARAVAKKDGGIARIPVTISTSRTTPFAVDWVAFDKGATAGEDYLLDCGRIEWTSSSQGTKYITMPLDRMAETSENEGFVIELVTGLGININLSSFVCEVSLYDTLPNEPAGGNAGYAASGWCEFAALDSTVGTGIRFARDEEQIRYSTRWADSGASCAVTASRTGGPPVQGDSGTVALHEPSPAPDEGCAVWNCADYEGGRYELAHRIFDADGNVVEDDSATFIVNHDVVLHSGVIEADEAWDADKVHLVVSTVTVRSGVTLTIAPDAIVKLMPDTFIEVEWGGLGVCKGAVLTHAYDDVMGGDTFFDGAATIPQPVFYMLSGYWDFDGSMHFQNYVWGGEAAAYDVVGGSGYIATNFVSRKVVLRPDAELVLPDAGFLEASGQLVLGERLTIHAQRDPVYTQIIRLMGSKTAPDVSNTELELHIDGVRSEANYSLASAADGLYIVGEDGANSVRFDLGEHGCRSGGGNQLQFLNGGTAVVEPRVAADSGWFFIGWDVDPATLRAGEVATALYKTRLPDLHVDGITIPATAATGERITISWTVGNTGYQSWNSKTTERILLVDAGNPERTRVIATTSEKFFVGSGSTATRSCEWQIPLRDIVGEWRVIVETAVNASNEFGGDNSCVSAGTIAIVQSPLPDLVFGGLAFEATPAIFEPTGTGTVSYVVRNTGTGIARAPWYNRVYFYQDGNRVTVAYDLQEDDIGPGEEVELATSFTVPYDLAGDVTLAVEVDTDDDIPEISDGDANENAGFEATPNAYIPRRLFLTLPGLQENGPSAAMRVMRTGDVSSSLALTITAANAKGNVSFPNAVAIPAGSSWGEAAIYPIDNDVIDGKRNVVFTVVPPEGSGFEPVTGTLTVFDNEVPSLFVSFSKTKVREGDEPIIVTVTRGFVNDEPLTVYLNGPSTSRCSYPSSVTIPANEASVTFELRAAGNDTAEIGASFTLRASAAGYNPATQAFDVEDDDVPAVTLEIYPEEISEGAGATAAYAILSRVDQKNISQAVTVNLSASMPKQLILPSSMTIPAYTMAVRFAIGAVDNGEDDGDREVTIEGSIYIPSCGCSGQPSTGDMIEAKIWIIDNDVPALKLTASPSTMKEGLDHAGDLILSHNSALAEDLVVALSYDTPNEIDIPEYVVIPAGETSVRVPVATIDDGVTDGGKLVSVYADDATLVFSSASTWIQVSDQNLPDYKVTAITHPGTVFAGDKFSFEFETTNEGFVDGTADIEYDVYLIGGRRGNATAPSNKVGHGKIQGGVPKDESVLTMFGMTAPDVVADYSIVVVLDPSGKTGELDGANNTLTSSALSVASAYHPTVAVADGNIFMPGEPVTIEGEALLPDGTTPASGVGVDVYVMAGNFRRTFSVTTDAAGRFTAVYAPSQGEAGHYKVGACYPGVNSSVVQDEFDILGMRRTSNANIIWDIGYGESGERYVYIENRSAVPITGLSATFENIPEECDLYYTLPDNIPGLGSVLLTLDAEAIGVTEQTDYKTITVRLECNEGLELSFPLYFHSKAQKAYLRSNPKSISTTMAIGSVRCIDITIANDGKGDSGLIKAAIPDVPWLKFVTYDTIENLKYGQSATLTLAVAPTYDDGLVLNNPRTGGSLVVSCENGTGCVIPLSFTPVSDGTGSVKVDALDNNTYVLDSAPHLANASVVLSNPYTGEVVARGTTGASGTWAGKSIPEGTYKATVSADNHDSWTGMVTVEPGKQATIEPFLQCKIVTVTWNVEKTEIEDDYEITLLLDYETRVPAPVVKTYMPSELPELEEGDSYAFSITLENTGVITAEKVTIAMPEIPGYTFTLSDNGVSVPAKSSVTISAVFSRPARNIRASLRAASATVVTVVKRVCIYSSAIYVVYPCGKEHPEYSYQVLISHGVCTTETIREYVINDPKPGPGGDNDPPKPVRPDPPPPSPPVEPDEPKPSPDITVVKSGCDVCLTGLAKALSDCNKAIEVGSRLSKDYLSRMFNPNLSRVPYNFLSLSLPYVDLPKDDGKLGVPMNDVYRDEENSDREPVRDLYYSRLSQKEVEDLKLLTGGDEAYVDSTGSIVSPNDGFKASVYQSKENNDEIVLAFAGTDGFQNTTDMGQNIRNGVCQETEQYERAARILARLKEKYPNKKIKVVGHSLGGGLTEYAIAKNNLGGQVEGVTYNSAGICPTLLPEGVDYDAIGASIRNYRTIDDYVSPINAHIGPIYNIPGTGHDVLERNSYDNGFKYFSATPDPVNPIAGDANIGWSIGRGAANTIIWLLVAPGSAVADDLAALGSSVGARLKAMRECLQGVFGACKGSNFREYMTAYNQLKNDGSFDAAFNTGNATLDKSLKKLSSLALTYGAIERMINGYFGGDDYADIELESTAYSFGVEIFENHNSRFLANSRSAGSVKTDEWFNLPVNDLVQFLLDFFEDAVEDDEVTLEGIHAYKPAGLSDETVVEFIERLATLGDDSIDNAIDLDAIEDAATILSNIQKYAESQGYANAGEMWDDAVKEIWNLIDSNSDSVCASVKLKLSQTLSMTREAFDGTLTLYNGHDSVAITAIALDISILDEDGNECKDLFEYFDNGVSGDMSEGSVLKGGLSVPPGKTGSALVRFIPERGAAPTEDKLYRFGGTVTYVDPFSGERATVHLTPVSLTVSPSPYLHLDYFVQRDVYADDPFTEDVIEASMPAELAVLVRNVGAANAKNVTIASTRPEVVENEKGLAVEFDLQNYTLDGSAVDGEDAHIGLSNVSLGTIAPNEAKVAQWWLTSSIQGHFKGMSATVSPVNSWNTPDTMLVDPEVGVHKLIRSVVADDDSLPDFLVSEAADSYGRPNKLYFSNGEVANVHSPKVSLSGSLVGAGVTVTVTVSPAQPGWNCGHVACPGLFRYEIASIKRGDGAEIPLRNAWITDRTFRDGADPLMEERLFIFDAFEKSSPQTYRIVLSAKVQGEVVEVSEFDLENGIVEYAARDEVLVIFSKPVNPDTFTVKDIVLRRQGAAVNKLTGVSIAPVDGSLTEYAISGLSGLCSAIGRYELVVQCAGIEDLSGRAGVSGRSVAWLLAPQDAPYIINAEGNPDSPVQSLDGIVAVTSMPVTEDSAGNVSVILNGQDVSGLVTVVLSDESGTKCQIEGLDSLQQEDGEYTLVIDASGLVGANGGAGINNSYAVSWTRDTQAPVLNSLEKNEGLGGTTFIVDLSEDADASTISLENFTLTRNGGESATLPQASSSMLRALRAAGEDEVSLPPSAKLVPLGNGKYAVSGLDSVLLDDGVYTLTFNATGVADKAGNLSSGATSVTWSSDFTPPDAASDIVVSARSGDVDSGFQTDSRELTISGKAGEPGLAVDIFAKYAGGEEVLLASPDLDDGLSFAATVTMPGDGAMSVIIRLTDPSGNSTDTVFQVFVDMIYLEAVITGDVQPGSAVAGFSIVFSAEPDEATALAASFSLTRDGTEIDISSVATIAKSDAVTYTVSGLGEFTGDYGDYVFTYDTRQVVKASSGISGLAAAVRSWTNAAIDDNPPVIEEILFDGETPEEIYEKTNCFDVVSVRFSESVNIPGLVAQGVIGQALSIQILSDSGDVTNAIPAENVSWDESTFTAVWTLDGSAIPLGKARFVVDSSFIKDVGGNALVATDGYDAISGPKAYAFDGMLQNMAHSYAAPTLFDWNGDGLLDLFVGEKDANGKGKVRIYLNEGDAYSPDYNSYAYLEKGGEVVEFTGQGCLGMQIAFGSRDRSVMYLATSQGEIYSWRYRDSDGETGNPLDFERWFDHDTDNRFSGLKRTCVFAWDIDADGEDEVVVSGQASPMFWMKRVVTDGNATTQCTLLTDDNGDILGFPAGQSHTSAVMLDVNGDTVADLVTGDTDGNVWVYYGNQNGGFAAMPDQIYANPNAPIKRSRLAVGDIDGDGVEDILVGRSDGSIIVLKGGTTLVPVVNFKVANFSRVTFDMDGVEVPLDLVVGEPYGEALPDAPATAKAGHTFGGWFTGPNGTGRRVTAESLVEAGDSGLYANWIANTYEIAFHANGGEGAMPNQKMTYGVAAALAPNAFTRASHSYLGWATNETGEVVFGDGEVVSNLTAVANGVVDLFAVWQQIPIDPDPATFTATFDANGGQGSTTVTLAVGAPLAAPAVTREGYTFAGWSPAVPAMMPAANVTCVAMWTPTTFTIAFDKNGGKLPKGKTMAVQTFSYGVADKLNKNVFTKKGYVFAGWAVSKADAKKGVIAYENAQEVSDLRTDGGTTALYAVWAKPKYKVAFYGTDKGVSGKMAAQSMKYGKAAKLKANKFKRKGYTFKGWATSKANAKKNKVAYKNKAKVKNLTITGKTVKLYAVWKKK